MDTQTQTKQMPQAIQDIWMANFQRILTLRIKQKYKLSSDQKMAIEQAIDAIYQGQAKSRDLSEMLKAKQVGTTANLQNIVRDVVGFCLLPAKDYFLEQGDDITKLLTDTGGVAQEYVANVEIMTKAIAEDKAGTYDHDSYLYPQEKKAAPIVTEPDAEKLSAEEEANLRPDEIKSSLIAFFEDGLDDLLNLSHGDILQTINEELIAVLSDNETHKKDLETCLLSSKLNVGKSTILLEDKEVPPTAANWLKEFFSVAGADSFDTLSIAKYIISSANAKKLSEEEQAKLRRFLTLYHNIHFFPTPFSAIPVDKWEIIPGARTTPTTVETKELETKIPTIQQAIKQPKWSVTQPTTAVVKETTSPGPKSTELIELETMRDQYAVGSLERSAIEEEIKHLKQN